MGFSAKFSGTCGICEEPFEAGAEIKRIKHVYHQTDRSSAWGHEVCPIIEEAKRANEPKAPIAARERVYDPRCEDAEPCCEGIGESGIDPVAGVEYDHPDHPENAEHVLALIETGREAELDHWRGHFS